MTPGTGRELRRGVGARRAVRLELDKLATAPVTRWTGAVALGVTLATTAGGYAAAQHAAGTDIGTKAAALVAGPGWHGLLALAAMSVGVTNLLAAGIVMAWAAGREFTEGTVVGLFALPASTGTFGAAKVCACTLWVAGLAALQGVLVAGIGLLCSLPAVGAVGCGLSVALVGALVGLSALPVMWVSTRGRGYLAGIGAALVLVITTNLTAGFGLGAYVPWAIPVLWATPGAGVAAPALSATAAVAALGAAATVHAWAGLQLGDQ